MPANALPFQLRIDPDSTGELALEASGLPGQGRRRWRLRLRAGAAGFRGGCSLVLPLPATDAVPWFLIPGLFYGQGRAEPDQPYPALGPADGAWTAPSWDVAMDRAAYPVVLAHLGGRWLGLDASPHWRADGCPDQPARWGDAEPQVGLGLAWADGRGELRINLPANERPRRHARCPRDAATGRQLDLPAGAAATLELGVWDLAGDDHAYHPVLVRLYDELRPSHPPAAIEPHAELAECAAHGLLAWHWTPPTADRPGYMVYTAAMDRSVEFNSNVNRRTSLGWHFEALGFVGGFPVCFGLMWQGLRQGAARSCDVARQQADRFCREAVSPCGLFRTSYHPGRARTRNGDFANGADEPGYGACWLGERVLAHARTTADASYYLARLITLCGPGDPSYGLWRGALRGSLEAALRLQRADGRHAQVYDVEAGEVRRWDGCAGVLWIAAMDTAHGCFADDPVFQARLVDAMQAAGAAYAGEVESERIYGAPEDVGLSPSSEDGYNAIMAYGRLHRRCGGRWLATLRRAADWTLSWRKACNTRFDPRSLLGAGGYRTAGGDYASSFNNQLHDYGLNCLAELHRLAELTGETYYARRADDNLAFACQQLVKATGQWNGQRGMMTEQFYTCDWSFWGAWDPGPDHVQKGTVYGMSHVWCINIVLLGLEELERAGRLDLAGDRP
jgi:hypothetical protein